MSAVPAGHKALRCPVCCDLTGLQLPDGGIQLNERAAGPTDGYRCRTHRRTPIDREVETTLALLEVSPR